MTVAKVKTVIQEIDDLTDDLDMQDIIRRYETRTRYAVIDPILWALGWKTENPMEVEVEYRRGKGCGRVDYALFNRNANPVVLLEAKPWNTNLSRYTRQIAGYALGMGQGAACITDGWEWEIYDLSKRGSFPSKFVKSVNLFDDRDAATVLNRWLRKTRWW